MMRTKLLKNSANGIQRVILQKGQKLGTVTSLKEIVSEDGSKPEVLSRIAQTTVTLNLADANLDR